MRRNIFLILIVLLIAALAATSASADPPPPDKPDCTKIQDGVILYSAGHFLAGQPLTTGYDIYGYNYQAHMFNGSYANVYLGRDGFPPYTGDSEGYLASYPAAETKWYWPYRDANLVMKWDQDWLANVDCDDNGALDRHYGTASYIGSHAWETNHQWGTYELEGKTCNWDEFVKIIAVPSDAYKDSGMWYAADGTEIGPVIWGDFAIIQEVVNDPCAGIHGIQYSSPDHPGFGGW